MMIIDTNVLISALIRDSTTRKILIDSNVNFGYPEISFLEIKKYEKFIIEKSGLTKEEYYKTISSLTQQIKIIKQEEIASYIEQARSIMERIDSKDVVFIAAALATNSAIWSDDKHFQKQDEVKVYTTKDVIKLIK